MSFIDQMTMIEKNLAIVLLDLIGSTAFVQKVGALKAAKWLQYHDRLARNLIYRFNGREIDRSDGFMLSFDTVLDAVNFALHYQATIPPKIRLNTRIGIHWGSIIDNTQIRDLGIYLYTTEQSAIEEYWFDINNRTFKPGYGYSLASRLWGNGYDNQTFWTSDIAAAYGIELYPIHAGSLYLGHNQAYAQSLWNEITQNTGILSHQANDNYLEEQQ